MTIGCGCCSAFGVKGVGNDLLMVGLVDKVYNWIAWKLREAVKIVAID